jgi:hypothetical protein
VASALVLAAALGWAEALESVLAVVSESVWAEA